MRTRRIGMGTWAVAVLAAAILVNAGGGLGPASRSQAGVPFALAGEPVAPPPPPHLSETGLYLPDGTIDPRNRPFSPQYPLWTDGAVKARWVRLPEGARIDVTDLDAWRFPPGTTFWKEFAFGGRPVETRMIRVTGTNEWTFATYVWNEQGTDAVLAPAEGVPAVVEVAPGKRHSIPGTADCKNCHASSPAGILGFGALQLSDDRDPLAPNAEALHADDLTLRTLVREKLLVPPRPELATNPPRIRASDSLERAALGYLSANCGGCHNTRGPLARLGFSLLHDADGAAGSPEPGRASTVEASGRYMVPGVAPDSVRLIAAGAPHRSALLHRMASRRAASQMPPLGTVMADGVAVALIHAWIERMRAPVAVGSLISEPSGD